MYNTFSDPSEQLKKSFREFMRNAFNDFWKKKNYGVLLDPFPALTYFYDILIL